MQIFCYDLQLVGICHDRFYLHFITFIQPYLSYLILHRICHTRNLFPKDPHLLFQNLLQCITKKLHMISADTCKHGTKRLFHHICRIVLSSHSGFQ